MPGKNSRPTLHVDFHGAKSGALSKGYAMRLEFDSVSGNTLPGRIYLELPQSHQTKFSGTFEAKLQ